MQIYFLRHGDASSNPEYDDDQRPLTDHGRQQAYLVGAFLKETNTNFDVIITSPLKRAQETASIIQDKIGSKRPVVSDYLLNGTNLNKLLEHLNSVNASSVLLVGHIPHLENTISLIVTGRTENDLEMKKCSLALVESSKPLSPGSGKLNRLTHVDAIAGMMKK